MYLMDGLKEGVRHTKELLILSIVSAISMCTVIPFTMFLGKTAWSLPLLVVVGLLVYLFISAFLLSCMMRLIKFLVEGELFTWSELFDLQSFFRGLKLCILFTCLYAVFLLLVFGYIYTTLGFENVQDVTKFDISKLFSLDFVFTIFMSWLILYLMSIPAMYAAIIYLYDEYVTLLEALRAGILAIPDVFLKTIGSDLILIFVGSVVGLLFGLVSGAVSWIPIIGVFLSWIISTLSTTYLNFGRMYAISNQLSDARHL